MPLDGERIYSRSPQEGALRQSEILSNLIQPKLRLDSIFGGEEVIVDDFSHPWVMVMNQDCDLELDFLARTGSITNNASDKLIPSILFCEIMTADQLFSAIENSSIWKQAKQNNHARYQFLQKVEAEADALEQGLPELGLDFKRFFSVPTEEVYLRLNHEQTRRRSWMNPPYLEHVASRFYSYQSRVALPTSHLSE